MSQAVERHVTETPVPRFLQEVGVRILHDKAIGARIVAIPREVRERCNVIDPVTSLVQADPNWTPRISVVELNPSKDGPHFYEQAGRNLAPTKQGLETLAKAAGVLYTRTARVPKGELDEGEIGYRATVGIRRSDGTVEELLREKVWVQEAERAEVEEAVTAARAYENGQRTNKPKFDVVGSPAWEAEVNKRWLRETRDRYAKTESKAVLRAIRAALQIPHTFSPTDAAKPFLVIGFNFTPDYDDIEVKRILVAAGLNAQAAIYGSGTSVPTERIDTGTGEILPAREVPADAGDATAAAASDSQQAEGAATSPDPDPAASSVPDDDDYRPEAEDTSSFSGQLPLEAQELQAKASEAGKAVVPSNRPEFKEKTIAEVAALGTEGERYLAWILHPERGWEEREDDRRRILDATRTYVQIMLPDLWAQVEAAATEGS